MQLITIFPLREESYYRSTHIGTLSAYDKKKFHIPAPKFELVINNRIDYLLEFLEHDPDDIKKMLRTTLELGDRLEEIKLFFEIIKNSIKRRLPDRLSSITYFITQISAGNMRIALKMFNAFLLSGNTKVEEMFSIGPVYKIAYYQFLKSVILEDSRYYIGDKSLIMNLFEINRPFSESHFLNLKILNYAYLNRVNDSPVGRGFVEINRIKLEAESLLINPKAVEEALLKLARYDLISFETQSKTDVKNASYICITPTGSYYLTQLSKHFIYLDLIAGDTPISDINIVQKIRKMLDLTDLKDRFEKTEIFLNYLKESEDNEFNEHPEYKSSELTNKQFMDEIIKNYYDEKGYIQQKLNI